MTLEQLKTALARHKVALSLSPSGRLRYDAPQQIPVTVLEGLKEHRAQLLAELTRNDIASAPARAWADGQPRTAAGLLDLGAVLAQPGHCGNCGRWQLDPAHPGGNMGSCAAPARLWPEHTAPPLAIHAAHRCAVQGGRGWQAAEMSKNAIYPSASATAQQVPA